MYSLLKTTISIVLLVLFAFATAPVFSQQNQYHTYAQMETFLEKLADDYPKLIQLESQGKTLGERAVFALTLGTGSTASKPAVMLVAGVNGTDLAGTEILLDFAKTMAQNYGKVDSVTKMLDGTTFYIFPRVNPDASESLFNKPVYARTLNNHPLDLDNDGQVDEDGYDDLNKDGQITWMRITEAGGEWLPDEEYPELLRKANAAKGETGIYQLIREGLDNDKDGQLNEDEPGGVNFNQNFTHKYQYFVTGAGQHQISEIETRAVADFAFAHQNITAVFSFSPNDNLNHPWEAAKGDAPEEPGRGARKPVQVVDKKDAPYFDYVSQQFKEITGLTDPIQKGSSAGAFNEWVYFHFGRWSYSTPAWWPPIIKSKSEPGTEADSSKTNSEMSMKTEKSSKKDKSENQRMWDWLQETDQLRAIVDWKEFKHPDFPDKKVEIGGFKPFETENPPTDSLSVLSKKYVSFFHKISHMLPRIDASNLKVEHLHDNLYRISLTVVNSGYLPTNTHLGTRNKWSPKIKISLELSKNQELAAGKVLQFIDILDGSGGSSELSWIVIGKKNESLKMTIGSPMTGSIGKNVTLQ